MRNAGRTVAGALESLTSQHYPKLEVIAWDGMSDDDTPEVLARYSDIITRVIREKDSGPPEAYNRSLEYVTGDFVGYLNADDAYEPGMLWAVAEAILKNPRADVISTGIIYRMMRRDGRLAVTGYYAGEDQLKLSLENTLSELPTFVLSRFLRRELMVELGPYNMDRGLWYISCDREWTTRLALMPVQNVVIPRALYGFTLHFASISSNPQSFTRIVEEHLMIADHLLERPDLTESQRQVVARWQRRQAGYGLLKALTQLDVGKVRMFLRRGVTLAGWRFPFLTLWLLVRRALKKIGLLLSGGIDRG